jgi:hypothetical protein
MAQLKPEFRSVGELSVADIEEILAAGRKRAVLKDELRAALLACDDLRALGLARELCGLEGKAKEK